MKLDLKKPYRRISGKGILVFLQNGHVFLGENKYVGPEPSGSGLMSHEQILEAARGEKKEPQKKKRKKKASKKAKVSKESEEPKKSGLFLGEKESRSAFKRIIGRD